MDNSYIYYTVYGHFHSVEPSNKSIRKQGLASLLNHKPLPKDIQDYELNFKPKLTYIKRESDIDIPKTNRHDVLRKMNRLNNHILEYLDNLDHAIEEDYTTFRIPKASGGTRKITAPVDELKEVQSHIADTLKYINTLPHNAAFAYVEERCTVNALEMHQANNSQWFLKLDLKNFFPNCTEEMLHNILPYIHPLQLVPNETLYNMIKVSLYEGGLPQGSPASPMLSNLLMVPFDKALSHQLWQHKKQRFIYTRYADDIIISSQYDFDFQEIIQVVEKTIREFIPTHSINHEKTRYGSRAGSNWNLGLMLNKDNNITIGYKKKQRLKATLFAFLKDTKEDNLWSLKEVQEFLGQLEYAKSIEPDYWDKRLEIVTDKLNYSMHLALSNYFY